MKITREGKRFILAAFLIAVAAINTGNNLIYLILSLMISFLLLSVVLLKINFSGLLLGININSPLFAGTESGAVFSVTNKKRFIPSYSIRFSADEAFSIVYYTLIPPGDTIRKEAKVRFDKRGLYKYGDFHIQSGFPFILIEKKMTVKVSGEILVYPPLIDVDNIVPEMSGSGITETIRLKGPGDELYSFREFIYGDDWRRIHWKVSARASVLLVKEYSEQEFRKATIIMDNLRPSDPEMFEKVVSLSASLSRYFLNRSYLVRLLSCKKVVPFGGGDEQLFRILDVLAVVKEENLWECPASYQNDTEGISIIVFKSQKSLLSSKASCCDMVIYADTL